MAVSNMHAQPGAVVHVGITLTPADVNIVARAIRSELASTWEEILAAPLPGREDIVRIRTVLDVYEGQLETLGWGEPQADVEVEMSNVSIRRHRSRSARWSAEEKGRSSRRRLRDGSALADRDARKAGGLTGSTGDINRDVGGIASLRGRRRTSARAQFSGNAGQRADASRSRGGHRRPCCNPGG